MFNFCDEYLFTKGAVVKNIINGRLYLVFFIFFLMDIFSSVFEIILKLPRNVYIRHPLY